MNLKKKTETNMAIVAFRLYFSILLIALVCIYFCSIKAKAEDNAPAIAKNIFIGDSRTVMMYFATHTYDTTSRVEVEEWDDLGNFWKAKGATDYTYMKNEAIPTIEEKIGAGTNVFILFGVNNNNVISYVDKYATLLAQKALEWSQKGANVYYPTVLPVGGNAWCTDTMGYSNERVIQWNERVKETFDWSNLACIDLYNDIGSDLTLCDDDVHHNFSHGRAYYYTKFKNSPFGRKLLRRKMTT